MATPPPPTPVRSTRKLWLFRVAAIACGLALFALAEGICIWFDWGGIAQYDDPFVGFRGSQPLFVLDNSGERYEIPPSRQRFFHPESFSAKKGADEFRIFVLGGSTVAGEPYATETSYATWLELALRAAQPNRDWNVVNCGGISYASYRMAPILKECLGYQPDLLIVSLGHNEFLEDRTYEGLKYASPAFIAVQRAASRLRTYTLVRAGVSKLRSRGAPRLPENRDWLPAEVDALLDHEGGLSVYHRDEGWHGVVVEHFGFCVREMIRTAKRAGVPIILVHEPSNLGDCPPFKSEHRYGMATTETANWKVLVEGARAKYRDDRPQAVEKLRQALAIDPHYALTWYELGLCHLALNDYAAAREAFVRARDLDVCPLRMITTLEQRLHNVADKTGVPLVNAHELLESRAKNGILGDYWLVDHVHPSFAGHQLIAETLLEEMARLKLIAPEDDSDVRRRESFDRHLDELPPIYFERGRRTLEMLRGWAQGRADGPPLSRSGGPLPGDEKPGKKVDRKKRVK